MKKLWHIIEKILGIYRWHPKIALRYLPIADLIKKSCYEPYSILEVGSAGLGITPYLKKRVVGIDLEFQQPIHPNLIPVKASALNLPFSNSSFDAVISSDMIEHIEPKNRENTIEEIIRVAKHLACIAVPSGELAQKQDEWLNKYYKAKHETKYKFLSEQVTYGLPQSEYISQIIHKAANKLKKTIILEEKGNINLKLRTYLMKGWISNNKLINLIFRKILILGIPFMRKMNSEPTYRKIFIIKIIS